MQAIDFDAVVGTIYDAVTSAAGFQQCIDKLVDTFELKAAMLFTHNILNGDSKGMWQRGMERRWLENYAIEFGKEDMLASHLATSDIAKFYATNVHLSAADYTSTRFFREWVMPQGIACAAGAIVLKEGVWCTQVVMQRSRLQPPFSQVELDVFNRIIVHLQRAVQMRQRFIELQIGQSLFTAGLDILAMPSIMFDESGCVAYHNQAAKAMLDQRTWFWMEERHLCTNNLALTKQINLEVIVAVSASRGSDNAVPGVVIVPRHRLPSLTLMITPVLPVASGLRGAAILFIYDSMSIPQATAKMVARLFSLTVAESELVVALCAGNTLEEAASGRDTSIHTVRSQLKSIFNKTGTHRQVDLMALVLSSPAYFIAHSQHRHC
ncbi:helix-turn-helix transcriptional regulator [Janthinobacterium sp. PSPC3-1]|uniref:helix-turn-helix transcriptional regulator n=1 Tax=Janthinobacterium sp. PSPC3-1 TaxID=2804653 RepID=UPI003CEE6F47